MYNQAHHFPRRFPLVPKLVTPRAKCVKIHSAHSHYKTWVNRISIWGFTWDASTLEGNPYTYVEVKTRLDGVTVVAAKYLIQNRY